jgi:hypothetical protein
LGAKLKKTVLPNGVVAWGMSSSKYVQSSVHNVKEYLAALPGDQMLVKKASGPADVFPVPDNPGASPEVLVGMTAAVIA